MQLPSHLDYASVAALDKQLTSQLANAALDIWGRLSKLKCIDKYITKDGDIWMCRMGHRFRYFNYMECPVCNSSRWERIWYTLTAERFGVANVQKDFIGFIELDIVIPQLRVAIEYNGEQHYKENIYTKDLAFRKRLDQNKLEMCKTHGIDLVVLKFDEVENNLAKWKAICKASDSYIWNLHLVRTSITHLKNKEVKGDESEAS